MLWLLCLKMLRFCAENYANQDGSHRTFFERGYIHLCVCQAFIHTWLCALTQCVLYHQNLSASCHFRLSITETLHDGFRHTVWIVSKGPVLGTNELLPELHRLYSMQARSGVVHFFFSEVTFNGEKALCKQNSKLKCGFWSLLTVIFAGLLLNFIIYIMSFCD